jgi:hypothetical protein
MSDSASFLLVRHPRAMETLRVEVSSKCDTNSNLSRDDLRRLPYLQKVLKESMSSTSPVEQGQVLMVRHSLATLSACSRQYSDKHENNGTPDGWWSRSKVSGSYSRRQCCSL